MNNLTQQIVRLISSTGDSNQTCLTLSPEFGWSVSWQKSDREKDAVAVISKDSLNEWANGFDWTDEQVELAAEYVADNIGDWLRDENITRKQIAAHI